jgi:hypothetical protein
VCVQLYVYSSIRLHDMEKYSDLCFILKLSVVIHCRGYITGELCGKVTVNDYVNSEGVCLSLFQGVKVKVNVKLSLCFNKAPRHEGVLGSGGIAPLIL